MAVIAVAESLVSVLESSAHWRYRRVTDLDGWFALELYLDSPTAAASGVRGGHCGGLLEENGLG